MKAALLFSLPLLFFSLSSPSERFSLITFLSGEVDQDRMYEFIVCMEKNIKHELIDDIHVIYNCVHDDTQCTLLEYLKQRPVTIYFSNGHPSFNFAFYIADTLCKHKRKIIANPDIFFNETLAQLQSYDLSHKFLCLNTKTTLEKEDKKNASPQDAWIFQSPFPILKNENIPLGTLLSGPLICYQAYHAGLEVENPSLSIDITQINQKNITMYWNDSNRNITCCPPLSSFSSTPAVTIKENTKNLCSILPASHSSHQDQKFPFVPTKDKSKIVLEKTFLTVLKKLFPHHTFIVWGKAHEENKNKILEYFDDYHDMSNCPASVSFLSTIVSHEKQSIFYIEDTHQKSNTQESDINLLDKLETLASFDIQDSVIIIPNGRFYYHDDARLKNTSFSHYPTLDEIIEKILSINKTYKLTCIDDLLIFFTDPSIKPTELARACTISRLFDTSSNQSDITELLKAEHIISSASRFEKETIKNLALHYTQGWTKKLGLCQHYPLWYGLILMHDKEYKQAYDHFKDAYDRGLTHWRVKWYMASAQSYRDKKL